jgi:hypothetical protein
LKISDCFRVIDLQSGTGVTDPGYRCFTAVRDPGYREVTTKPDHRNGS